MIYERIGCQSDGTPTILEYPSECKSWFYANGVVTPHYPVPAIRLRIEYDSQYKDLTLVKYDYKYQGWINVVRYWFLYL